MILVVFDVKENRIQIIRSSDVSVGDQLLMYERAVSVKKISICFRHGFDSPLTLSGQLMVNNISTSVFSDRWVQCRMWSFWFVLSYDVSPETLQRAFGPVRVYYRLMRRLYGAKKKPFETDDIHPLIVYYKKYSGEEWRPDTIALSAVSFDYLSCNTESLLLMHGWKLRLWWTTTWYSEAGLKFFYNKKAALWPWFHLF